MIVWLGYLLIGCALGSFILAVGGVLSASNPILDIWNGLENFFTVIGRLIIRRRAAGRPYFDTSAARRESYALGLPFPESDGTLSWAPEPAPRRKTDAEVHAEIHGRRMLAQFGRTSEETFDAIREAFTPADQIADAVVRDLPERPTQEVFNDLLAEYFRNR